MTLVLSGRNRFVLLTRRYALKIPSLRSWRDFLFGLLNNMNEARISREQRDDALCPVLFAVPGGFLIVMPRALVLPPRTAVDGLPLVRRLAEQHNVEPKHDSFGYLNDRLVAVDYGWPR